MPTFYSRSINTMFKRMEPYSRLLSFILAALQGIREGRLKFSSYTCIFRLNDTLSAYNQIFFHQKEILINRGSYTSCHFIWNLWNEPLGSFINFIWNDHECKILFIMWLFELGFYRVQNEHYFNTKTHSWHDKYVVNDVTCTRHSVITRVVIRFLWHDVIHWF